MACEEASRLHREIVDNLHRFVLAHGISQEFIDRRAEQLVREWGFDSQN